MNLRSYDRRGTKVWSIIYGLLFVCFLGVSCGYTTKSTLPPHLRTIHIENFDNKIDYTTERKRNIYIPLLEVNVRNAIIDRFLFDGNLRIADAGESDLTLKGSLRNYERSVLRYTGNEDVEEYRIHITVSLQLYDEANDKVMWSEPSFVGEATFFIAGPAATSEESAIEDAIEDLARRIVERTIEDW